MKRQGLHRQVLVDTTKAEYVRIHTTGSSRTPSTIRHTSQHWCLQQRESLDMYMSCLGLPHIVQARQGMLAGTHRHPQGLRFPMFRSVLGSTGIFESYASLLKRRSAAECYPRNWWVYTQIRHSLRGRTLVGLPSGILRSGVEELYYLNLPACRQEKDLRSNIPKAVRTKIQTSEFFTGRGASIQRTVVANPDRSSTFLPGVAFAPVDEIETDLL